MNREKLGMTVELNALSSINSSDEMLGCELMLLSYYCRIKDGVPRFFHVVT